MPDPVHSVLDPAFLAYLADSLRRAIADNPGGVLVHVATAPGGPDIGILPLDGQAPAEVLRCAVAPDHWVVLGVATGGKAWPLDGSARRDSGRAEVVVLVARDGRVVGRVSHGNRVFTEPPASGLVLDCLQRALALPTAPPDVPPAHLLAVIWLERVLGGESLARADEVLSGFEGLGSSLDWGRLRQLVARGAWPELGLTPEDADWFDDGAFCRWVVSRYRPLPFLLAQVQRTLDPAGARRCVRLLRRLGVEAAA